jgi:hypothetical protein
MVYKIGGSTPTTVKIGGSTGIKSATPVTAQKTSTITPSKPVVSAPKVSVPAAPVVKTSSILSPSLNKTVSEIISTTKKANAVSIPNITVATTPILSPSTNKAVADIINVSNQNATVVPKNITVATVPVLSPSIKVEVDKSIAKSNASKSLNNIPSPELSQKLVVQAVPSASDIVSSITSGKSVSETLGKSVEAETVDKASLKDRVTSSSSSNTKPVKSSSQDENDDDKKTSTTSSSSKSSLPGGVSQSTYDQLTKEGKVYDTKTGTWSVPKKSSVASETSKSTSKSIMSTIDPYGLLSSLTQEQIAKNAVTVIKSTFKIENPLNYSYVYGIGYVNPVYNAAKSANLKDKSGNNIRVEPTAIYSAVINGEKATGITGEELYNSFSGKVDSASSVKKEEYYVSPGITENLSETWAAGIAVSNKDRLLNKGWLAITGIDVAGTSGKPRIIDVDPSNPFGAIAVISRKASNWNIPMDALTYGTLEARGEGQAFIDKTASALLSGKLPSEVVTSDNNLNRGEKLSFLIKYGDAATIKKIAAANPKAIAEMSQDIGLKWQLESVLGAQTVASVNTKYGSDASVTKSSTSYKTDMVASAVNEYLIVGSEGMPVAASIFLAVPETTVKGVSNLSGIVAGKSVVGKAAIKEISSGGATLYKVIDDSGKEVGEFKKGETVNGIKVTDAASAYKASNKVTNEVIELPWTISTKKVDTIAAKTPAKVESSAAKVSDDLVLPNTDTLSGDVPGVGIKATKKTGVINKVDELNARPISDGVYKVSDSSGTEVQALGKTGQEAIANVKAGKYTALDTTAAKVPETVGKSTTEVVKDDIPADYTHQPTGVGADSGSGGYSGGYSSGGTTSTPVATGPVSTIVDDAQRGTKAMQVNGEWYILDKKTGNYMPVAEYDELYYRGSTIPIDETPVTEYPTSFNTDRGVYVRQLADGIIQAYDNSAKSWIALADYDSAQAAKAAQVAQDIADANALAAANAKAAAQAQYAEQATYYTTPASSSTVASTTVDEVVESLPSNLNEASVTDLAAISDQLDIADPSTLKLSADKEAVIWNKNAQNAIEELKATTDIAALSTDELKAVESALAYHEGWGKYDAVSTALFKTVYNKFSAATKKIYGVAVTAIEKVRALIPSFSSGTDDTATVMMNLVGNTPMGRILAYTYAADTRVAFKTSTLDGIETALATYVRNTDFYKNLKSSDKALTNKVFKNLLTEESGKAGESLNTLSAKEMSNWDNLVATMPDDVKARMNQAQVLLQKDADELKQSAKQGYTEITTEPSVVPDNEQITKLVTESSSKEPTINLADLDNSGMVSMYSKEELPAMYAKRGESLVENLHQTKTYQNLDDTGKATLDAALEHQSSPTRIYFLNSEAGVSDLWKSIKSDTIKYPDAYDAEKLYHEAASSLSLGSSNGVGRGPNFELALDKLIAGDTDEARALIKTFNDLSINADRIDFLASRANAKVEQLTVDQIISLGLDDDKARALLTWKQNHASKTLSNLYGTPDSVKTALFDEQSGKLTQATKTTALSDAHELGGRISKLADDALDMDIDTLVTTKGVPEMHTEKGYNYIKQQFDTASGKPESVDIIPGYEARAGSFNENGQLLNGYIVKGPNGKYITSSASDVSLAIKEVRTKFVEAGQHELDPFDINIESAVNKLDASTITQLDGLDTASLVRNPKLYDKMISIAPDEMKSTLTVMRDTAIKVQEEKLIQFDTAIEELKGVIKTIDEEFAGMRKAGCA